MNEVARLREREGSSYGGSAAGIRSHYDISNDFWPQVLGRSMAYSCALYAAADEDLDAAQARKIDWHVTHSGAHDARSVLDVGCGWGSVLRPLSERGAAQRLVGLTLSEAQAHYLAALQLPRVEARVENWAEHVPTAPYDSIVSIGAFEHFAKPQESQAEKIAVYRDFFERCRRWLGPHGRMTLQTIAYGAMAREEASDFINEEIFPDSDLPYLQEILQALDGLFEVVMLRNDRLDYARTMDAWGHNLQRHRERATEEVGEKKYADMLRFFKLASMGFRMGKQHLLRFALRPISHQWSITAMDHWGSRDY